MDFHRRIIGSLAAVSAAVGIGVGIYITQGPPPTLDYRSMVLADNPVALWQMNGNGSESDLTGQGHTGTYTGGQPASAILPDGETAADFNGSSQYMEAPSSAAFSIPTTHMLTWEAWIRPDVLEFPNQAPPDNYVDFMGKCKNYGNTCEWESRMYSTTTSQGRCNRVSAYVFKPSAGLGSAADWQPWCNLFQANQWYHVVGEYQTLTTPSGCNASFPGTIAIWVNGTKWSFVNHSPTGCMSQFSVVPTANNSPLDIGTMALDTWFKGAIGYVGIYNYLLSQNQIRAHYAQMTGYSDGLGWGVCESDCGIPIGSNIVCKISNAQYSTGTVVHVPNGGWMNWQQCHVGTTITTTSSTFSCNKALNLYGDHIGSWPLLLKANWNVQGGGIFALLTGSPGGNNCVGDGDPDTIDYIQSCSPCLGSVGPVVGTTADALHTAGDPNTGSAHDIQLTGAFDVGSKNLPAVFNATATTTSGSPTITVTTRKFRVQNTTNGTIPAGSTQIQMQTATAFGNRLIYIEGAGAGGADLVAHETAFLGSTMTIDTPTITQVTNANAGYYAQGGDDVWITGAGKNGVPLNTTIANSTPDSGNVLTLKLNALASLSGADFGQVSLSHQDCIQLLGGYNISIINARCGDWGVDPDVSVATAQGAGGSMFFSNVGTYPPQYTTILGGYYVSCNHGAHGNNGTGRGTISSGSLDTVTVAANVTNTADQTPLWRVGSTIWIKGAGSGGSLLQTTIQAISGTNPENVNTPAATGTLTISPAASQAVAAADYNTSSMFMSGSAFRTGRTGNDDPVNYDPVCGNFVGSNPNDAGVAQLGNISQRWNQPNQKYQ